MVITRFIVLVLILSFCNGCIPVDDYSVTLSFWTDNELNEDGYKMLFINDRYIGDFDMELENPACNELGLLNYKIVKSEDLTLSVHNVDGDSIEIGVVNLFSVSTGLKIKPSEHGKIFVDQSLDDDCTMIHLNWNE